MSRNRFQTVIRFIRFDNKDTRRQRRELDKFCPIRTIWERIMSNCFKSYQPHTAVTVDEQLLTTKARCLFTQYLPAKPGKFGLKFWLCCDSDTNYILNASPYVGKDPGRIHVGLGEHVVLNLTADLAPGLNITTDNYFTSQSLVKKLKLQKMTLVGTVRANRKEVPKTIAQWSKTPELYETRFLYCSDSTLLAYKSKKNKVVLLLSSMHKTGVIDNNHPKKLPEIIKHYNSSKCGVDTADQMLRHFTTKTATRRWPVEVFFNLVDICALNSYIISKESKLWTKSRRKFLLNLSETLCNKFIQRIASQGTRDRNTVGVVAAVHQPLPPTLKRTTCRICQSNKTKISCIQCGTFICGSCSSTICKNCVEK